MGFFGGRKKPPVDVRAMLTEASRDFGGEKLAQRALYFFDNRKEFEIWDGHGSEPPWIADDYEPEPAEVAADILFQILGEDRRRGFIDWATGNEGILEEFDILLDRAGAPPFDPKRRAELLAMAEDVERGKPMLILHHPLIEEVRARGLEVHWWDMGQDAHFPHVLSPAAEKRWRDAKFGKGCPVLR